MSKLALGKVYPSSDVCIRVKPKHAEELVLRYELDRELNILFGDTLLTESQQQDVVKFIVAHTYLRELWSTVDRSKHTGKKSDFSADAEAEFFRYYREVSLPGWIETVHLDPLHMSFSGKSGFGEFHFSELGTCTEKYQRQILKAQALRSPHPLLFVSMNECVGLETLEEALLSVFALVKKSSDYRVKSFERTVPLRQFVDQLPPDTPMSHHICNNNFTYSHNRGVAQLVYNNPVPYKGHYVSVKLTVGRALLKHLLAQAGLSLTSRNYAVETQLEDGSVDLVNMDYSCISLPCHTFLTSLLKASPACDNQFTVDLSYKVLERLPWATS